MICLGKSERETVEIDRLYGSDYVYHRVDNYIRIYARIINAYRRNERELVVLLITLKRPCIIVSNIPQAHL